MRLLILSILSIFVTYIVLLTNGQVPMNISENCLVFDLKESYRHSIYQFIVNSYKTVALYSNVNFVFSPNSIWIMLAAIAEGGDKETQESMFQILGLPDDPCLRQKFYKIATTRATPVNDVSIFQTRTFLVDEGLTINPEWLNFVSKNSLLDVVTAPIRKNPIATANEIKRLMAVDVPRLNLTGNSVLLDVVDYNGLWATAFADAIIERAPFYNVDGVQIGAVDLMRVKRKARMGYVKSTNFKVLELPVGSDKNYRMLLVMVINRKDLPNILREMNHDIIHKMFGSLKESNVPLDIAVPRIGITGEVDVRTILEGIGVKTMWTKLDATKYISNPPALPTSYLQRASVILNKFGVNEAPMEHYPPPGTPTGLDPEVGCDFIANQPFLLGLFDSETYTPLVTAAYTKPTYML